MNYYDFWKNSKGNRDIVFNSIFKNFHNPITILEIGVSRDLNPAVRSSDGWSSLYFTDHTLKFGGKLISVDLDPQAISNCKILCEEPDKTITHEYYTDFGTSILKEKEFENIDFIYLDGGDDPQEMVDEYELIKTRFLSPIPPVVLADDFHSKGYLVRQKYPNFFLYKWENNVHEIAMYGFIGSQETIFVTFA